MTKRMTTALGAIALALATAACGGATSDPFAAATPDARGLALETSGTAAQALTVNAATSAATCPEWAYLCRIRAGVQELNTFVKAAVEPVEALAQTAPTAQKDDTRTYGPVHAPASAPVATFLLIVKKDVDAETFKFKLEGKPLGADDSKYVVVMAGKAKKGDQPHRGRGVIAMDLDKLATLNPPAPAAPVFKGSGQILAAFSHAGQAKSLAYLLKNFVADTTVAGAQPVDLALVGHKTPSGETRVRLASVDEVLAPQSAAADSGPELVLARGRWVPGNGGRAAVVVSDFKGSTDVASYSTASFAVDFFLGVSCWGQDENEGYHHLFACTRTPTAGSLPCADVTPASWPASTLATCKPGTEVNDAANLPPATSATALTPEPMPVGQPLCDAAPGDIADLKF
jgi:hypothetical protein